MKLEDFAAFVEHGAAMIKQIECGRKKLGPELRDKIHLKTGVPHEILGKEKLTREESDRMINPSAFSSAITPPAFSAHQGVLDGSFYKNRWPAVLLPEIMALWFLMLESGINSQLGVIAIRREIEQVINRFSLDKEKYRSYQYELGGRLFPGGRRGLADDMTDALRETAPFLMASKLRQAWLAQSEAGKLEFTAEASQRDDRRARELVEKRAKLSKKKVENLRD